MHNEDKRLEMRLKVFLAITHSPLICEVVRKNIHYLLDKWKHKYIVAPCLVIGDGGVSSSGKRKMSPDGNH